MKKIYFFIKDNIDFFEQVLFSLFSFMLIGFLAKFSVQSDYISFIKAFSTSTLVYGVFNVCVSQAIVVLFYKEGRSRTKLSSLIQLELIMLFLIVSLLVIICLIFNFNAYELMILVSVSLGWTTSDLSRKLNFVLDRKKANIIITLSFYTITLIIACFLYTYMDNEYYIKFLPIYFGISMFLVGVTYLYTLIAIGNIQSNQAKSIYRYGLPFFWGTIIFWMYSQGVYVLLSSFSDASYISEIRTCQNITGVLSIAMIYYENKYMTLLSERLSVNESYADVVSFIKSELKSYRIIFSFLSFTVFLFSMVFTFYFYGYGVEQFYMIFVFSIVNLMLAFAKPFVVSFKVFNEGKYILYAHLSALIIALLASVAAFLNSGFLALVLVSLPYFVFSFIILGGWFVFCKKNITC